MIVILFGGDTLFEIPPGMKNDYWNDVLGAHYTILYNVFVFMIILSVLNTRKIDENQSEQPLSKRFKLIILGIIIL
jgi:hypothetical protein